MTTKQSGLFFSHNSWKKGYEMFLHHQPHCPIPDEAQVVKSGVSVQHWNGCAVGVLVFNLFSFLQWGREEAYN